LIFDKNPRRREGKMNNRENLVKIVMILMALSCFFILLATKSGWAFLTALSFSIALLGLAEYIIDSITVLRRKQ